MINSEPCCGSLPQHARNGADVSALAPQVLAFRPYQGTDRDGCLGLFDANCPGFFAPNERPAYRAFLASEPSYYEICLMADRLVGAFGLAPGVAGMGSLQWVLIAPHAQGRGVGTAIMVHVLDQARTTRLWVMAIAASHKSAPFFIRFGAKRIRETPDGWGPGMHRVDMQLAVAEGHRPSPPAD